MTIIIDPTGGGDFETIQAWADVATDDEPVLCRGGGDLGGLTLTNANAAGTVISAAPGHQHDGTLASLLSSARTTGAWVTSTVPFSVDGIAFSGATILVSASAASGVEVRNCLFSHNGPSAAVFLRGTNANVTDLLIENCVAYASGSSSTLPIFCIGIVATTGNFASTGIIRNCTARRVGGTAVNGLGGRAQAGSGRTGTCNVTISNCGVFGFDNDIVEQQGGTGGTETINGTHANNASSDGTADDFGGSGHLVDQLAADWFVDPANDLRLKKGSRGLRVGSDGGNIGFYSGAGIALMARTPAGKSARPTARAITNML